MCLPIIMIMSLGMKGDMVWTCSLPVYKATSTRHKVISRSFYMGSQKIKIIILSFFHQFDLEMTLRLHRHDIEVIPS